MYACRAHIDQTEMLVKEINEPYFGGDIFVTQYVTRYK